MIGKTVVPRRIAVYGGSFDPIHRGHLEPVEEVRRRLGLDAVVFVPAYVPPHKPAGPSASAFHRFAMAAMASAYVADDASASTAYVCGWVGWGGGGWGGGGGGRASSRQRWRVRCTARQVPSGG